jgi:hypothetical protein
VAIFTLQPGVELSDLVTNEREITITIKTEGSSKYRVQFIGKGGQILQESISNPASYQLRGNELYVRARVIESNGKMAWIQPIWRQRAVGN